MINNEIILIIVVLVQLTMMYFSELLKVAHLRYFEVLWPLTKLKKT